MLTLFVNLAYRLKTAQPRDSLFIPIVTYTALSLE